MKVMITGATGLVGEGVLLECLAHPAVTEVLMVNRRHQERTHPKLKELILPDFTQAETQAGALAGYDACFYCAGVSSVGLSEADFTKATYGVTLAFASALAAVSPGMIFGFVSGNRTDSTERGKVMWARVKGRTENALMKLGFKRVYCFRPGFMKPTAGQQNLRAIYKAFAALYPVWITLLPGWTCRMSEVGQAMINSVLGGYPKQILEVADIKALAKGTPSGKEQR